MGGSSRVVFLLSRDRAALRASQAAQQCQKLRHRDQLWHPQGTRASIQPAKCWGLRSWGDLAWTGVQSKLFSLGATLGALGLLELTCWALVGLTYS